ncbi:anionic trypsin-1-like [Pollicipes pollicipes]|uniref:anionic trypsin-1-like n=1 Tax=Pollicipes pollicipes TaxID=41117 RepID=UPI0018857BBC|nr:anionic trypsin-1-like [Pollicipes pollicipes]
MVLVIIPLLLLLWTPGGRSSAVVFPPAGRSRCGPGLACVPVECCGDYETVQQLARQQSPVCKFRGLDAFVCCRRRGQAPPEQEPACGTLAPPRPAQRRRRETRTPSPEVVPPPILTRQRVMVVQGTDAAPGRWPWMVLLGRDGRWMCGGALLSRRFVLTAAHCVPDDADGLAVRLGEHRLSTPLETEHHERRVARVLRHPDYAASQNDLALLELAAPVDFSDTVRPICLPPADADHQGRPARLAGWGLLQFAGRSADVLQEARLRVADTAACEAAYRGLPSFSQAFPGGFGSTKLCASAADGGRADACQGDSGGPLVYRGAGTDGIFQLVGIVSTGAGCGNPDFPGVYTRVSSYVGWINSEIF